MELDGKQIAEIPIHLILCTERTGSSMLAAMLNTSDEILCASEELFALYFYDKYHNKIKWTESEIKKFVEELMLMLENSPEIYFSNSEILFKNLIHFADNLNYQLLIRIIYLHFIDLKNKKNINVIVDKQIKFLFHIPEIKNIFPNAKIILLTRDIRDNVVSKSERMINGFDNVFFHAGVWVNTYSKIIELKKYYKENIQIIHYEKLVSQPSETLKTICNFLNVKYSEEMLNFNIHFKNYLNAKKNNLTLEKLDSITNFHDKMYEKINPKYIGSWKNKLNIKTSMKISAIGYNTGKLLGYDFEKPYGLSQLYTEEINFLVKAQKKTEKLFRFYLKIPLSVKLLIKRWKR